MGASGGSTAWYVLVRVHTEGFELYQKLRKAGFDVRIAPVPRGLQACCGMSIMVKPDEVEQVRARIEQQAFPIEGIVAVEGVADPGRDRFC